MRKVEKNEELMKVLPETGAVAKGNRAFSSRENKPNREELKKWQTASETIFIARL
jgi:hypothetical protein